jgi:dipeptidyl aminopeptidase/acylaminoacyl peptidase
MVRALEQAGGTVTLTIYPDAGHVGAWERAYRDSQLFPWLLQHQLPAS